MRIILAAAIFVTAMVVDLRPVPARSMHRVTPCCLIDNTGGARG